MVRVYSQPHPYPPTAIDKQDDVPTGRGAFRTGLPVGGYTTGANDMSKERKSTKENKKKPMMTAKEKKAAKKSKKAGKGNNGLFA